MTSESGTEAGQRQARSMIYEHEDAKYVVTVGEPRVKYPRKTDPRGGYIKDADWQGWGTPTGSTVTAIIDAGRFHRGVLRGALARLGQPLHDGTRPLSDNGTMVGVFVGALILAGRRTRRPGKRPAP